MVDLAGYTDNAGVKRNIQGVTLLNPDGTPASAGGGGGGGSVEVTNFPAEQAVTGPLTNTQLRAAAVPVTIAGAQSVTPTKLGTTTRLPVWASGQHVVTSATSAKTTAITGTEVMISLSADAYIRIGTAASVVATKGAASMFLPKGGPYTFQLTSGEAVAVIMDTAAGVMSAVPVA